MHAISPTDASLLVLVAQNPGIRADELEDLLESASPIVRDAARALVKLASGEPVPQADPATRIADAFLKWARENKRTRESKRTAERVAAAVV